MKAKRNSKSAKRRQRRLRFQQLESRLALSADLGFDVETSLQELDGALPIEDGGQLVRVFLDLNANGLFDSDDRELKDVPVFLDGPLGSPFRYSSGDYINRTDEHGFAYFDPVVVRDFSFNSAVGFDGQRLDDAEPNVRLGVALDPGWKFVVAKDPSLHFEARRFSYNETVDSSQAFFLPTTGIFRPRQTGGYLELGFRPYAVQVSGTAYEDLDGDGNFSGSDRPLEGITVFSELAPRRTTKTLLDGSFAFSFGSSTVDFSRIPISSLELGPTVLKHTPEDNAVGLTWKPNSFGGNSAFLDIHANVPVSPYVTTTITGSVFVDPNRDGLTKELRRIVPVPPYVQEVCSPFGSCTDAIATSIGWHVEGSIPRTIAPDWTDFPNSYTELGDEFYGRFADDFAAATTSILAFATLEDGTVVELARAEVDEDGRYSLPVSYAFSDRVTVAPSLSPELWEPTTANLGAVTFSAETAGQALEADFGVYPLFGSEGAADYISSRVSYDNSDFAGFAPFTNSFSFAFGNTGSSTVAASIETSRAQRDANQQLQRDAAFAAIFLQTSSGTSNASVSSRAQTLGYREVRVPLRLAVDIARENSLAPIREASYGSGGSSRSYLDRQESDAGDDDPFGDEEENEAQEQEADSNSDDTLTTRRRRTKAKDDASERRNSRDDSKNMGDDGNQAVDDQSVEPEAEKLAIAGK